MTNLVTAPYYLKLSQPLKFEAVSRARLNNVFYDECNKQVFSVQSGASTEVVVKSPEINSPRSFQMPEKGPVISIKFNQTQDILAVQRNNYNVEFINLIGSELTAEYTQSCKSKNAQILGFVWTSSSEICFITDQGVELYQVDGIKATVKYTKSLGMSVKWFLYSHCSGLLLLSSGALGTILQPLYLNQANIHKLSRFEIESVNVPQGQKLEERDTMLGNIYGQPCVLVLRHYCLKTNQTAEVIIYTIKKMSTVQKSHVLKLGKTGRFAMSIVNNLVFVHHQASKTSLIFDIGLEVEYDGSVYYHCPVTAPQPIKENDGTELYSSNWIIFPPNTVIDIKIGRLWTLMLELEHIPQLIQSKCFLIEFLMLREDSREIIFKVLREMTQNTAQDLEEVASVFDKINTVYQNHLITSTKWELANPGSPTESQSCDFNRIVVDQLDMYTNVLSKLADDYVCETSGPRQKKWAGWVLLEYLRSLTDYQVPAQHYLHELLINSLVQHKAYYQLHQLLQYYIVSDSKPLACLLLSLQNLYPAAHQLALDMLQRLSDADQEITEVLLSKEQILPALRYAIENGNEDQLSERKFIEATKTAQDKQLFYAVSAYFQTRSFSNNGPVAPYR